MVQNPVTPLSFRRGRIGLVAAFIAALTVVATPILERPAAAAPARASKYEVCHRTNAIKNPYRRISVAWSSVDANNNGHDNPVHDGPVFNVANPTATHGSTPRDSGLSTEAGGGNDRWGDIFNAVKTTGNQTNSNNWTTAGQAIFNGATFVIGGVTKVACKTMSAIDYIKSEREENPTKPMGDIVAELDDMEAADDAALKTSLGGSFTTWYDSCNKATTDCENTTIITSLVASESPSVTTETPSPISAGLSTNSTETATLKGTVSPLGIAMTWYFEFDDDTDFTPSGSDTTDVQEVPGTPGATSSPTTINVSHNATGLDAAKTYYYRTVGVATSGSADALVETFLYGVTRQFAFGAPASPTITGITCGDTSLSIAFTAGSANGGTITNYQYSLNGGETFTPLASPSTASPISIPGLTNGTEYGVAIRAITSSKIGADSATTLATPCGSPTSTTTAATNVLSTTATINGHLTGNGNSLASISFTWGTSSTLAAGNTTTAANSVTLAGTAIAYPVLANLTGLTGGTRYYFEVRGTYASGASTTLGGILSFETPAVVVPPAVTTEPATNVLEKTATLNGTGTSNGSSSTLSITWGKSPTLASGNTVEVPAQSPLSSSSSGAVITQSLTGLTGGTTYYFRVSITNPNGSANGVIRSFTTLAASPTPTTPTTAPTASATSNGGVAGTVWIDTDGDDEKDATEVWFPGISLSLTGTASGNATTNSVGAFSITGLAVGTYKVKATLPSGLGLSISWDSQGPIDWEGTVTVVAGQTARVSFAAKGNLEAAGKIMSVSPGTEVNVDWSGVDKNLDTVDDVTFTTSVKDDQTFALQNIPSGRYRVRAQSLRQVISVGSTGATFESATISFVVRLPELPSTGGTSQSTLIPWALLMIPSGIIGVAASRRRRSR